MPNILVKIPKGSFPGNSRTALAKGLTEAAATAEQMPADPKKQFVTWVLIDEVESGSWTCGGADVGTQFLPCMAVAYVPSGVLDEVSRGLYVQLLDGAFKKAIPVDEKRQLVTSIVLNEVFDGNWGANGTIWKLPELAKASGFAHLQYLVREA